MHSATNVITPHLQSGIAVASRLSATDDTPGKRLKELREIMGLRQQDVAQDMNLSRAAYCQYETGSSKLKVDMVEQLAFLLQSTPEYIAFGIGDRSACSEIVVDNGRIRTKGFWRLDQTWLKNHFNVKPSAIKILETPFNTPTLQVGDKAFLDTSVRPTHREDEFALIVNKELVITNVTVDGEGGYRIFTDEKNSYSVPKVDVIGRVIGFMG